MKAEALNSIIWEVYWDALVWQVLYKFSAASLLKSIKKDLSGAVSTLQIKTRKIKALNKCCCNGSDSCRERTHLWLVISLLLGSM